MIGYACINTELRAKDIFTSRSIQKKKFESEGLKLCSELSIKNLIDLKTILYWNKRNNILVFRMSSEIFPWMSNYNLYDLPNFGTILSLLEECGRYAIENKIRLSFHPGPFNILGSFKEDVVKKTIKELNQHCQIMDLMYLPLSHYYPINIHVSLTKPSKELAINKFIEGFLKLDENTKKRLVVENDDSPTQYSVLDLFNALTPLNIPITFDQHHFLCGPQDTDMETALRLAHSSWGEIKPLFHHSSSKQIEDPTYRKSAHADYIYEPILNFGLDFDTEIEAKMKEQAVIRYKRDYILS